MVSLDLKDFMRELSEGVGVSGHEQAVGLQVKKALEPLVDEAYVDRLSNTILVKRGEGAEPRPKVMLAGHMDEVGMLVSKIDKKGFLRFTEIGLDQRILPAHEVVVHGKKDYVGVIGVKPPHILSPSERKKAIKLEDMYIDIGLSEEEAREQVEVGDLITYHRRFTPLQGDTVAGKSFDDRAGVVVIAECLKELSRAKHLADVYGVATVQEEVGFRGAITGAFGIKPDIGIAIDVTQGDTPGVPDWATSDLGKGPAIAVGANVHPKVFEALRKIAEDRSIPYQVEPAPAGTGTDAWAIQVSQAGVATGLISIPLRYMHTSVETMNMEDVKNAGRLLAHFIIGIDSAFMEALNSW